MVCLSTHRRTRLLARITALENSLDAAYTTLAEVMASQEESYRFDSKEAMQQLKNVDLDKLQKTIDNLEVTLEHLYQKLRGVGVVRMNLRRKQSRGLIWRS
jgi:hypothetical protein